MHLKSMTLPEMTAYIKEMGQPTFRAKQVYSWLHKAVSSYEEMSNIPQTLRDKLRQEHPLFTARAAAIPATPPPQTATS